MRRFYTLSIREKKYFCLTVPVEYVKRNSLSVGDELFFYQDDTELVISDRPKNPVNPYVCIGVYKLSRKGKRGWITTAPAEWVKAVSGRKGDPLTYRYDDDCANRLIIKKK